MIKLTEKDHKLLNAIDLNARDRITSIAKKVGSSKELVLYRLKRLEDSGLIQGYKPVINHYLIGKQSIHLFLSLTKKDLEYRKELEKEFMNISNIKRVVHAYGEWDFILTFHVDSIKEFKKVYEEILSKYDKIINKKRISIVVDTLLLEKNIFYKELRIEYPNYLRFSIDTDKKIELKEEEIKVLRVLVDNARNNLTEISKKTGITMNTVKRIIDHLEKEGVIVGYYTVFNPAVMDLDHYKLLLKFKNFEDIDRAIKTLITFPETIQIQRVMGDMDLEVELYISSIDELESFLGKLTNAIKDINVINIIPIMSEKRIFPD